MANTQFKKGEHSSPATEFKKGVYVTPQTEFKKGLIPWHKGKKGIYSQETLDKMRLAKIGKKLSKEHKLKMSLARKGHITSDETRIKISASLRGSKHWNWNNGSCEIPYPLGWSKTFREQIRQRDNYKCQICGVSETECINKLSVHHIDYDKSNLDKNNLITLCISCHNKTNSHKERWLEYFRKQKCLI